MKIEIDPTAQYQSIEGFGWTLTQGSAALIRTLPPCKQKQLLNELFHAKKGLGSSVVRIGIGATDLSAYPYTYSETAGDPELKHFSLSGPDETDLIPLLKKILKINPDIRIIATPWTAPKWMKTEDTYTGASLKPEYYGTYARYFIKYFEAMRNEGIEIWAITPQNEPLHAGNEPSMHMSKEEQYEFIEKHLGPAIAASDFSHIKIIAYDHNCDVLEYPEYVSRSQYVHGSAFHLYDAGSNIAGLTRVYKNTGKPVYFTEQYTGPGGFGEDFNWHMINVMLGSMNNYARTALEWNLASDPEHKPHTPGGCNSCVGAVTIEGNKVTRNVSYFLIAQMSKVAGPGAIRMASESGDKDVISTAFRNPDGTYSLIVYNAGDQSRSFDIVCENRFFSCNLKGQAAASFLWKKE